MLALLRLVRTGWAVVVSRYGAFLRAQTHVDRHGRNAMYNADQGHRCGLDGLNTVLASKRFRDDERNDCAHRSPQRCHADRSLIGSHRQTALNTLNT